MAKRPHVLNRNLLGALLVSWVPFIAVAENRPPNFLLIMVDDMGWTDLGAYGSEINTPTLDKLAEEGLLFTDFHASVSCSPTRSMLLTGTDNHLAGMGNMGELLAPNQVGQPGYEGHLNDRVVTLAEVLRDNGYHTYMAGKWHLGHDPEYYPFNRGFEQTFSMLYGGASHYDDMNGIMEVESPAYYTLNGERIHELPATFYSSRSYADFLMDAIRSNRGDDKPFLGYFALTSPHDPLHVPEPWQSKYRSVYDEGYDALREKRAMAAKEMGLVPSGAPVSDMQPQVTAWDVLSPEEQAVQARGMEVYAGMVDNLDYHVGRVLNFLDDIGELDNTVIFFLSDNGSNPWYSEEYPGNAEGEWFKQFDNSPEAIGDSISAYAYGMGFAAASSGPLDRFKMTVSEGGIRVPLLIAGPGVEGGRKTNAFSYVTDLMPTMLDMAGIAHPETFNGTPVERMLGKSLAGLLAGEEEEIYGPEEFVGGELLNGKWMRQGAMKAVSVVPPYGDGAWRLFDIEADPGETTDLSVEQPEILRDLVQAWDDYAEKVGVILMQTD
ncbi:sulfatase-like hydrolase/transferase [Tropicimonas sp. TH_r6]|uniref:sulfatase-like hydrolase/transferase n=1 Tax=Tropicimonas sp. TH_r6 TaxID=3082085 RepID=UPI0029536AE2|nr:sulfatase-like hydrolase/transferase [Tropicimonas sp. TH_r6]MDV7145627.1 sulfatase-like hydrolase/transferase [Tropicimonas sp. TH_r6]